MSVVLQRFLPFCAVSLVVVTTVATTGCDKGIRKITVKGTVTYDGKPVNSGILKFSGPNGAYSASNVGEGGAFIMTDVVPGETKVGIMEGPQSSGSSSGAKTAPSVAPMNLPEKLRDPESSGVKVMITPETKELNIELK